MPSSVGRRPRRAPLALLLALLALWASDARRTPAAAVTPPVIASAPAAPAMSAPVPPAVVPRPLAGSVVDAAGAPIAGVHVRFRDSDVTAESDANGELHFEPPAGAKLTLLLDAPHVFPAELPWLTGAPPPRILLARRARLAVRVTANGAPAAGAEVQITDGSRPTLATARTDPDGTARFDDLLPGPYELWARRDTAVSSLVRVADVGQTQEVALALAPAGALHGQVVADAPLAAGSTVQLVPLDLDERSDGIGGTVPRGVDHAVRVASLDREGRFAIDGVPRGRWRVEARAPGYVDGTDRAVQVRGDRDDVTIRLVRAGAISGTVIDAGGAPVANATIVLRQQGVAAPGRALDEPRAIAAARLRWVHPLAGTRQMPVRDAARFGASRPGTRAAECGQGHCGNDLGSQRGAVVHAAADGEIVAAYTEIHGEAGRMVAIDHGGGLTTMYMHLDRLRAGLEAGQRVRAGDPLGTIGSTGFALDNPHLHFAVTQERAGRTWYLDPEPMLRHAVVLPAARSLDPVDADARTVTAALRSSELRGEAVTVAPGTLATDANGRFRLDGIAPGSYVVVAFAEQLAPGVSTPFVVRTAGETPGVTVTLRPGVLVRGRVLGRDGAIDGATITAAAGFGETANKVAMTYSSRTGEFVLRALTGKITLTATAPGYGELERTVTLDDAAAQRREDFVLTLENAQLHGQVLAPDGGAAGAVAVRVIDGPTRRRATSDAVGRFTVGRVAAGSYLVEITSPEYPPVQARLQTGEWKELRLAQGGGLRVVVRDARSGAPLAGSRIEATGPSAAAASRVTDARGLAELRALAPGAWTLVVRATGYSPASHPVAIEARHGLQDLVLDLPRAAILAGVVRDRYGRRVAGARVSLGSAVTQTDPDGNFRLDDVAAGAGSLEAEHQGARGALQLQLAPGDERLTLTIELAE